MACRRRPLRWCACSSAQQPPAALATVTTARVVQELVRTHGRVKDDRILFAASRDGFSNHVFHENCGDGSHLFTHSRSGRSNHGPPPIPTPDTDGFSPTLTFVLLHNGCLFGAYTAIPWSSISGTLPHVRDSIPVLTSLCLPGPHPDPAAFLFSLSDGKPPEQGGRVPCRLFQFQNKGYSVWHAKDKGPLFGIGAGTPLPVTLSRSAPSLCALAVSLCRCPSRSSSAPRGAQSGCRCVFAST